ncbi:hypothetical protein E1A91_D06G148800v1 [Gossypium mustelinum]|uniref:Uncharacterized protein n=2 Tax=Gossypium TaxID=3633 RepID=A0A5D2UJ33_GOSMU|nr:hypothetical protein E1A91_D06G148800v1 [Gossypium mustelinum]
MLPFYLPNQHQIHYRFVISSIFPSSRRFQFIQGPALVNLLPTLLRLPSFRFLPFPCSIWFSRPFTFCLFFYSFRDTSDQVPHFSALLLHQNYIR